MKRQGSSTSGQPPVKKTDASTDLRSKIGAKLQTLLNGIDTDAILYAKRRKQLYEDLFGKPKYSEIIIDPTIVIKEEPDIEECTSDSSTLHNSQNFLQSAKCRLTELLNKQQDGASKYKDSGKENTLFSNRNKPVPGKSSSSQNPSSSKSSSHLHHSSNKKRNSNSKEHRNPPIDARDEKNLVVVLEDCMQSKRRTKSSTKCSVFINSANLESNCVSKKDAGSFTPESSKSYINSETVSGHSRYLNSESMLSNDPSPSKSMVHAAVFSNTGEYINQIGYYNEDESEMVDDPLIPQVIVDIKIGESISADGNCNFGTENSDSEVELLCEKERTAEVITLEDNDDECIEVSEEQENVTGRTTGSIHKCKQCGKSFRAESLLNFHVRMHGNNVSQSPSSSSHSFS